MGLAVGKPDYLPENLKKLKSFKAICLVCGDEYQYPPDYKQSTCGKFECLSAMAQDSKRDFVEVNDG